MIRKNNMNSNITILVLAWVIKEEQLDVMDKLYIKREMSQYIEQLKKGIEEVKNWRETFDRSIYLTDSIT